MMTAWMSVPSMSASAACTAEMVSQSESRSLPRLLAMRAPLRAAVLTVSVSRQAMPSSMSPNTNSATSGVTMANSTMLAPRSDRSRRPRRSSGLTTAPQYSFGSMRMIVWSVNVMSSPKNPVTNGWTNSIHTPM